MTKSAKNTEKKRLLRLPAKTDKAVIERAKENQRSVNGQIIFELDQRSV